jgi:hypothetical protein
MGKYKIAVTPDKINLTLEGKFTQEEIQQFSDSFQSEMKKINPTQYTLEIDAAKFQVLPSELHDSLKGCFELYQHFGFKQVLMHHETNVILSMQVKRIASEAGLLNFDII